MPLLCGESEEEEDDDDDDDESHGVVFVFQNNSISPSESLRTASEKHRSSSDFSLDSKKRKVEEKDRYVSV